MMEEQSKKVQLQKALEVVRKLRLMDDDLMSLVFGENIDATQYLLSVILQRDDLMVLEVAGQREYKNPKIKGRKLRIDVYAKDRDGKVYDIEIQRSNRGAGFSRARYHSSMIDVRMLEEGQDFDEIRESYVIFITENDVIGLGLPIYHIHRTIDESGDKIGDGSHIIYVNGSYQNMDEEIGRLMYDFRCEDSKEMLNPMLANHVKYYKENQGGAGKMSALIENFAREIAEDMAKEIAEDMAKEIAEDMAKEIAEDMAKEMAEERAKEMVKDLAEEKARESVKENKEGIAIRMLKKGKLSLEDIADYSNLPLEFILELKESLETAS